MDKAADGQSGRVWPALGIHAKSAVKPGAYRGAKTAAVWGSPDIKRGGGIHDEATRRRYLLQRKAQRILFDKYAKINRHGDEVAAFRHRVAMCNRGTDGGNVEIWTSPDRERADFKGVQTCGSVWHCPICSPKISNRRRDEINQALVSWLGPESWRGERHVYLATYTGQHSRETASRGQLDAITRRTAKALSSFKSSTAYKRIREAAGVDGVIRALEVTYGEMNGWHVHTHELIFAARGHLATLSKIRKLWARTLISHDLAGLSEGDGAVVRFGKLRALLDHCFTVKPGTYAAEYVAKYGTEPEGERGRWGLGSELTRQHMKKGRASDDGRPQRCGHASPWALLNDALDGDELSEELFREFAIAFQGRRQLFWSPGLRKRLGIVDVEDQDIADNPDERCTIKAASVDSLDWRLVIAHEARFDLLRAAALGGPPGVESFLATLRGKRAPYSGEFASDGSAFIPIRRAA